MAAVERAPAAAPVLGLIVPCHDEASVIERKLANLRGLAWPDAGRPHRVVVVDDGSRDATAALAARAGAAFEPGRVALRVVTNAVRPGKSGAIEQGLRALAGEADLVVLTDADVVFEREALVALARAFVDDPRLGLACGAQRFVAALADDGSATAPGGGEPTPAAGLYDRLTARVRACESRAGRLFSVHGQLLAWRASLGLAPTPGYAADDLDLMLQARAAGARVALAPGARFLEVKTPPGPAREAQALRRARAYVQLLGHPRLAEVAGRGGPLERLQVWAYRRLPTSAPWWIPSAIVVLAALAVLVLPRAAAAAVLVALGLLLVASPGRRLLALLGAIHKASRSEARASLSDRWETPRA